MKPTDKPEKDGEVTRREFLKTTLAGAAVAGLAPFAISSSKAAETSSMPTRLLGKTGVRVSVLGFGGGSRFLVAPVEEADAMLEKAIASGITYFDTAEDYGKDRESEKRLGRILPNHRKAVFLAAKNHHRTYDGMMRSVEEGLKNLRTDYLDLMQMHQIQPKDDLSAWEKPDGALTALRKLRDQKVIRFIGFTGHDDAEVHKKVIETFDFDTVLMALNAAGFKKFHEIALPAAVKKDMGIIAMKTTKGLVGTGQGKATPAELLNWTFTQPISTVIIGMENQEILEENVKLTRTWKPRSIEAASLELRLSPHVTAEQLGWPMPQYRDA